MTKALGPERADNILARITPPTRSTKLEMLKWLDAKEIAGLIEGEHPQVMAIVLAYLDAPVAADVLQLLPGDCQEEIVFRIATLGPVSGEALDDLEKMLLHGSPVARQGSSSQRGGASEAATIMNNVRKDNEQRIMKALGKRDKTIALSIEEEMFVFDNLIDMDEKNLSTLMRTIDNDVLVVALKGCNDMLKGRIFGCMSARAAVSIQDELAERGPMRLAEVIEAQKLIIATARRMADAGTIMLGGKGNDFV